MGFQRPLIEQHFNRDIYEGNVMTVLGCIADDFTGATDLAGLLARSGMRVSLRIGVPPQAPSETSPFEVIALKSRAASVSEAVAETRAALDWLQRAGAQRFFLEVLLHL